VSSVSRLLAGVIGVLVVTVVALTGCATKGVPYHTPSSSATSAPAASTAAPAPTVSMSSVPAASGQLTGTQLQTVLLPQSFFPAGFTLSSSSAVSSGGALLSAPAQYNLATVDCATFVNHFGNTGFGETALAAVSAVGQSQAFDQVIYQFGSPAAATAFVAGITSAADRCGSFTATSNGATGTFSLKAVSGPAVGGHPSVELTQAGVLNHSQLTIDTVLSASGVDVFAGSAVGLGASAPASLAPATIVYNLMKRQAAVAVLGS
jgi:hypothetical protein